MVTRRPEWVKELALLKRRNAFLKRNMPSAERLRGVNMIILIKGEVRFKGEVNL